MHLSSSPKFQVFQWWAQHHSSRCSCVLCVPTSKSMQGLPRPLGKILPDTAGQTGMIASPGLSRACTPASVARLLQDLCSREATPVAPLPQHLLWALACSQTLLSHNCLHQAAGAFTADQALSITWSAQLPCLASSQSLQFPCRLQGRGWGGGCARGGWARTGIGRCRSSGVQAHVWVCKRGSRLWTLRIGPLVESRGLWIVQVWAHSCCNPPQCCHSPAVLGVLVRALKGAVNFRVAL